MFCRWKSTDNKDINTFLSLENPCAFLLVKEKTWKLIFNTNSELSQNRTEKQIMPFKTAVNWLFNDIWFYLFIGCFDWKTGDFQQTKGFIVSSMHFTYENKAISSKMEILLRKEVEKMKKTFDVETLAEESFSGNSPEENPTCAEEDE